MSLTKYKSAVDSKAIDSKKVWKLNQLDKASSCLYPL